MVPARFFPLRQRDRFRSMVTRVMTIFRSLRPRLALVLTVLVLIFAAAFPLAGGGSEVQVCGVTITGPILVVFILLMGLSNQTAPLVAPFEPNLGQFDASIAFASASPGWSFAMDPSGRAELRIRSGAESFRSVRLGLEGSEGKSTGHGEQRLPTRANYLMGRDPTKWATDVPQFAKVRYREVYPGIDEIHSFNDGRIETDFEVRPGADPQRIRIRLEGVDRLDIDPADGSLVMHTGAQEVRWGQTRIFHPDAAGMQKKLVPGRIRILSRDTVGFEIGEYDRARTLVIDPVLNYLSYVGRNGNDGFTRGTADANGNFYLAGATGDPTFPVSSGAFQQSQPTQGRPNATVTKLNADGSQVVYVTHFGGTEVDVATGIALDAAGNIYVTGATNSPDFPVSAGGYQRTLPQGDGLSCFVMKLNPAGNAILYSTYLNGAGVEACSSIAVDAAGSVFVAGFTNSANFPITPDAFQTSLRSGGLDASRGFVTKLNPAGSGLVYSTFLGGSGRDVIFGLAIDSAGAAYVAGSTNSGGSFPVTTGAAQTTYGGSGGILDFSGGDGFAAKISPDGARLVYATYIGGRNDDTAFGIAVDSAGAAYVTGATLSTNFPVTPSALQSTFGGSGGGQVASGDAFLVKLNPAGSAFSYATYLGGSRDERGGSVAVDRDGNAWVVGHTLSPNFPVTADAMQKAFAGSAIDLANTGDGFITKVNAAGSQALYSTFVGGSANEYLSAVAITRDNAVLFGGGTASRNLPTTPNAAQRQGGTGDPALLPFGDGFAGRIGDPPASRVTISRISNNASLATGAVSAGMIVTIDGGGLGPAESIAGSADDRGVLLKKLAETRVLFDGVEAPLVSVSDKQVIAIVPFAVDGKTSTSLIVENGEDKSAAVVVPVVAAQPGLFTVDGSGVGAVNSEGDAAAPGAEVTLLATGFGQTDPAGVDGLLGFAETLPVPVQAVKMFFGEMEAEVLSASGLRDFAAGYFAIRVRIPEGLAAGAVPLVLQVGEARSQRGVVIFVAAP